MSFLSDDDHRAREQALAKNTHVTEQARTEHLSKAKQLVPEFLEAIRSEYAAGMYGCIWDFPASCKEVPVYEALMKELESITGYEGSVIVNQYGDVHMWIGFR